MTSYSYRTPPLEALRGFVAVARRMSITLAAQDLCLTQSAVSRQIQAVEEHLGTPLFVRRHRALELTLAGQQLFALAAPWFQRLVEFSETIRGDTRPRPVTISASMGVTTFWILPRLSAFQARYPQIDVRVAASNRVLDLEREGIDLAIRYCREKKAPKGALFLFGEEVFPVARADIARRAFGAGASLREEVLLELDDPIQLPWLQWSDWLEAAGNGAIKPRAYLRFNQYDQVIQAALAGQGVALGRRALIAGMLDEGRLVADMAAPVGQSDYAYWLIRPEPSTRPEIQLFADWIIGEANSASTPSLASIDR